ncbi:hypothetical protein PROFUN_16315 [Planoprotostelium fungivorum]|uniref:Uncharacterized protein n=1 Tax=Planoprotostelium fungivorum TaxID=1890364 RepID=A0A2P6MR99_9EUKA|nr:hypothetical protein PROFUN_16315 [Planoprotostelium fungivorum]
MAFALEAEANEGMIHKDGLVGWYKFKTSSWGWASNNPLLLHNTIVDR